MIYDANTLVVIALNTASLACLIGTSYIIRQANKDFKKREDAFKEEYIQSEQAYNQTIQELKELEQALEVKNGA